MTMKDLKSLGELPAKICAVYHNQLAERSECDPNELTTQLNINDDKYIYIRSLSPLSRLMSDSAKPIK